VAGNVPTKRAPSQHSVPGVMISRQLAANTRLGDYVVGAPLWPLRAADAYRAVGPNGPATLYVVQSAIAQNQQLRDALIAGTRAAAQLPEHKHLVRTIAAGLSPLSSGEVLWIATEEAEGSLVRDMLVKKRQAGQAGLGVRAAGNLAVGVCAALSDVQHGALSPESVVVNRAGRVRVIDLALASGTIAALRAGLIAPHVSIAPEVAAGENPSSAADVYSIGALLYEALVGRTLERGGQRPSEVIPGASKQIDEVIQRACQREASRRFGRVDVLSEVVAEALGRGGAMMTQMVQKVEEAPSLENQVSLAAELAAPSPAASGNANVDRVLAAALADTTEKWLITKGRLDYGPFSLADVVAQIDKGAITGDAIIMDKDSGARTSVGLHPLLGPLADTAKARIDDQRRAAAEVVEQKRESKRGVLLYAVIAAAVIAIGVGGFFVYDAVSGGSQKKIDGVTSLEGGSLKITLSEPKPPPKPQHSGGGRRNGGGGGGRPQGGGNPSGGNGNQNLSLDLSDDSDDSSETLPMGEVFNTYSHYGAQLGGCLARGGAGTAHISFIIDGKSGHVTWVSVNNAQSGGLYSCLGGVMRSMQFRPVNGVRTRAEFDIGGS
jgi:hypothetical protein